MTEHHVEISISRRGRVTHYRVTYKGAVLVESPDPEHAACRSLEAMGLTGTLVTRWAGSQFDAMRLDIQRAAKLTCEEGLNRRLRVAFYEPPDFERLRQEVRPLTAQPNPAPEGNPHAI